MRRWASMSPPTFLPKGISFGRDPRSRLGPRRLAAGTSPLARSACRAELRLHLARPYGPRTPAQRGTSDAADSCPDPGGTQATRLADARLRRDDAPRRRLGDAALGGPHAWVGAAAL